MGIFSPPEKGKTPLGTEEKGKRFYPILGVFSPLYWEKLPKGITKVITTTGLGGYDSAIFLSSKLVGSQLLSNSPTQ